MDYVKNNLIDGVLGILHVEQGYPHSFFYFVFYNKYQIKNVSIMEEVDIFPTAVEKVKVIVIISDSVLLYAIPSCSHISIFFCTFFPHYETLRFKKHFPDFFEHQEQLPVRATDEIQC